MEVLLIFGWKTRENVVVLDFLAVDNFDFTRKIVKKFLGEKLVKMLVFFCQNWIFGQKFDFSNSVKKYERWQNKIRRKNTKETSVLGDFQTLWLSFLKDTDIETGYYVGSTVQSLTLLLLT